MYPTAGIPALPGHEWGAGNLGQMVPARGRTPKDTLLGSRRCFVGTDSPARAVPGVTRQHGVGGHTCALRCCPGSSGEVVGPPLSKYLPSKACKEGPIPRFQRGLRAHLLAPSPG